MQSQYIGAEIMMSLSVNAQVKSLIHARYWSSFSITSVMYH